MTEINCTIHKIQCMNIELTTCCPLHCPQCYCTLEGGKHIDLETAKARVREGAEHGVSDLQLSGGETMCYPHLYELIEYSSKLIPRVNVALSGWHFNEAVLHRLTEAGTSGIFISLNGSTKEINSLTRDGYDYAVNALQVLKENKFPNTFINFVMHSNNTDDFENVISLAEKYEINTLVVLAFKPDASHKLLTFPSPEQIMMIADTIKKYRGKVKLSVESCFSQLLAVIKDTKLFGNLNVGPNRGCGAGISNYSIDVNGDYSPCRHLDLSERYDSVDDYLENSDVIKQINEVENNKLSPCAGCRLRDNCRPCLAVSSKLYNRLAIGHDICGLHKYYN